MAGGRTELLAAAAEVLDAAAPRFVAGIGAPSAVDKGPGDFATEFDLELERRISKELADRTGIAVHGEEFGARLNPPALRAPKDLAAGRTWVLDPIDGTFNYSAGLPLCGMLLALLEDGVPTIGLTWLPLLGKRYAATVDGPLYESGTALPPLRRRALAAATVAFGSIDYGRVMSAPGRLAALGRLSARAGRARMLGSTGVDLAFTAAGILGGAVIFSYHPWDNAPGVALARAAGAVVTDLAGRPWTLESDSVLAAAPGIHQDILRALQEGGSSR